MAKKALNKWTAPKSVAPERIIQFGEGNFLRAFERQDQLQRFGGCRSAD